jgi:hypothetical protein
VGGKAIKSVETRRLKKSEYYPFESKVLAILRNLLPDNKIASPPAYREKSSFGDLDVIISNDNNAKLIMDSFCEDRAFAEVVKNGNCWSVPWTDFQVDFVFVNPVYFDAMFHYFSYNDIGNLMGRIAKHMGFKLGQDGLSYRFMQGTHLFASIHITTDYYAALSFLGLDPERFRAGFNNLDEVFAYVISSPYFSPEIYAFENRNAVDRRRDSQRPNYQAFLAYTQTLYVPKVSVDKPFELERAFIAFPLLKARYDQAIVQLAQKVEIKSKFNGKIVHANTQLETQALGAFIMYVRSLFEDSDAFNAFILGHSHDQVVALIQVWFEEYQK